MGLGPVPRWRTFTSRWLHERGCRLPIRCMRGETSYFYKPPLPFSHGLRRQEGAPREFRRESVLRYAVSNCHERASRPSLTNAQQCPQGACQPGSRQSCLPFRPPLATIICALPTDTVSGCEPERLCVRVRFLTSVRIRIAGQPISNLYMRYISGRQVRFFLLLPDVLYLKFVRSFLRAAATLVLKLTRNRSESI